MARAEDREAGEIAGLENPEKSVPEQLEAVLARLTPAQIRFVTKRQETATDKEAAIAIGVRPDTVTHWKCRDHAPIDLAIKLTEQDNATTARHIRKRNLAKAMHVKAAGLDSEDERIRQAVATEIIEWELGKAQQGIQHSGTGPHGEILTRDARDLTDDELANIAAGSG